MGQTMTFLSGASGRGTPWAAVQESPSERLARQQREETAGGLPGPAEVPPTVRDFRGGYSAAALEQHRYNRAMQRSTRLLEDATAPMRYSLLGPMYLVVRDLAGRLDHLVPPRDTRTAAVLADSAAAEALEGEAVREAYSKWEFSATSYGGAARGASVATDEDMKAASEEVFRRVRAQLAPAAEVTASESPYAAEAARCAARELLARESLAEMEELADGMREVYAEVALWFSSAFFSASHAAFNQYPSLLPFVDDRDFVSHRNQRRLLRARETFVAAALKEGLVTQVTGHVLAEMEAKKARSPAVRASLKRIFTTAAKAVHDTSDDDERE